MASLTNVGERLNQTLSTLTPKQIQDILDENERERQRIYETYGDMTTTEARTILQIEEMTADCKACDGTRTCAHKFRPYTIGTWERDDHGNIIARWADCPVKKKRIHNGRKAVAKIPYRFKDITSKDYLIHTGNENAVIAIKSMTEDNGAGVYLHGEPGVGKSMLAAITANLYISRGMDVYFADTPTLLASLRTNMKNPQSEFSTTLEAIIETDFVVIDDIGAEKPTEWTGEQLFRLINTRYNERLPTVITSNFDLEGLYKRLGETYVASRICRRIFDSMNVRHITA